jgi:pimeloyl-ACP methyl ester carboxylesterase
VARLRGAVDLTEFLSVDERAVAVERRPGKAPGLFWLGGFRSDMAGGKASALDTWGETTGHAVTRFDYSGHGQSGGDFNEGTISRWLAEALAVFETTADGQIVVGSSMGGWLALLLVRELRRRGASRVKGLILIAPATDMTQDLMLEGFNKKQRKALERDGFVEEPSDYGAPYRINRSLIEDGAKHLLFGKGIDTGCPVIILQGGRDRDVPREHAMKLVQHLLTDPVHVTIVPDGDHRLSRPEDLVLLTASVERMLALIEEAERPPPPPPPTQLDLLEDL